MAPPGFLQDPPALGNQLVEDAFLVSLLRRLVPENALADALPDLGGCRHLVRRASTTWLHACLPPR